MYVRYNVDMRRYIEVASVRVYVYNVDMRRASVSQHQPTPHAVA